MAKVARLGDPFSCGDTIAGASGNVYANGIPLARDTDPTTGDPCGAGPTTIDGGAATVTANGLAVALVETPLKPHSCPSSSPHGGSISAGSPNVTAA
ncbi:unnamed protein product [marine sediment metagenome]|uniref:PAAR repeat-containing protein n=1 Tax=marine sediment metagenome TaxID=412755 RepID=X0U1H7_9ZZZZ